MISTARAAGGRAPEVREVLVVQEGRGCIRVVHEGSIPPGGGCTPERAGGRRVDLGRRAGAQDLDGVAVAPIHLAHPAGVFFREHHHL